jgi:AraC-like DNA-binding protein
MNVFYREIAAAGHFNTFIQKFWILNNSHSPFSTNPRYALPNGCCTIAFVSGNGLTLTFGDKVIEVPAGIYLSGQITKRAGIAVKPGTRAIMAQVKPWLPLMITKVPMNELVNNVLSLQHLNTDLYQKLTGINFADEQILVPEFYRILKAYINTNADYNFTRWAFSQLQINVLKPTVTSIADIAAASRYSQRRVEQKFKELIGLAPKEIQRILKLRWLVDDLSSFTGSESLSALAYRHGFYDQSHFIKSYQHVLSDVPSAFNKEDYLLPIRGHFDFLQY